MGRWQLEREKVFFYLFILDFRFFFLVSFTWKRIGKVGAFFFFKGGNENWEVGKGFKNCEK